MSKTIKSLYLNGFQNYYNPTSYANTSFDNFSSTIHTSLSFEGSNSSTPYGGGDSGVTGGGDGNNPSPKASGDMTLLNDSKLEITNEEGSESTKQEPVSENGGKSYGVFSVENLRVKFWPQIAQRPLFRPFNRGVKHQF